MFPKYKHKEKQFKRVTCVGGSGSSNVAHEETGFWKKF